MGVGASKKGGVKSVEEAEFDFRNSVKRRNLEEMLEEDNNKDKLSFRPAFLKKENDHQENEDLSSPERRPSSSSTIGGWIDELKGGGGPAAEGWDPTRART